MTLPPCEVASPRRTIGSAIFAPALLDRMSFLGLVRSVDLVRMPDRTTLRTLILRFDQTRRWSKTGHPTSR